MTRRARDTLILLGVPVLLVLALGGWMVDAIRTPLRAAPRSRSRHPRPLISDATQAPKR
jgi:hypothetical protein